MPPRPVRQKGRTDERRRRLRVGMVDRLSPIDRNLEATAASKIKEPNSRKTPPLARRAEPLGTMALHCKMPPQPVRQKSRTAERHRRLRVGRSHWGQWLYTVRHRRLRVGMVAIGGCWEEEKKRSRNRSGVLLFSGRFKDRTAHRKCGWVLLSPIDSKDE
jgi:hypothetical protein